MKIPNRWIGFINFDNKEYPFEFDEKNFVINLYPPSCTDEFDNPFQQLISHFESLNNQKIGWIDNKRLKGKMPADHHVIFDVLDNVSSDNGFLSFEVNWCIYNENSFSIDEIEGFTVEDHDINLFYPPEDVFEIHTDNQVYPKFSVSSEAVPSKSCGVYPLTELVDATIEVGAYAYYNLDDRTRPLSSKSYIINTFSEPVSYEGVIRAYKNIENFLRYVCYRNNIGIGYAKLFFFNEEEKRDYAGLIVFPNKKNEMASKAEKKKVIDFSLLKKHSSIIIDLINHKKLPLYHLCQSTDDLKRYNLSRIILIFTAFEREFRDIYGIDYKRSNEYSHVKSKIVSMINKYMENLPDKKSKGYAKDLRNYVSKRDRSFKDKVKDALSDCENIMKIFVLEAAAAAKEDSDLYNSVIIEISQRMSKARNAFAHGEFFTFDAIHLNDVKVIEKLIYVMRLKSISISAPECQQSIQKLMPGTNYTVTQSRS